MILKKQTTNFKMTLSNNWNELNMTIWASKTPKQFLMHVHTDIHRKQMGLEVNFKQAKHVLEQRMLDADFAKQNIFGKT